MAVVFTLILLASSGANPSTASAAERQAAADAPAQPDNTGRNVRDRDGATLTPIDQGTSEADVERTRKIRDAITSDHAMSMQARNAKVITREGVVTLRGPVASFIAAGPLLAAMSGAAVGAAVGGLTGALVGMGIPEYEAKQYEGKVKGGNILISVHTPDADRRKLAKEIFDKAGAKDVRVVGEKSV